MTMRRPFLASVAVLALAGSSAHAAGEVTGPGAAPEPASPIAPQYATHPPAVSASPPIKFLLRLLVPKPQKEEEEETETETETLAPVAAEPMVLVPPPSAAPERPVAAESGDAGFKQIDKPRPKPSSTKTAAIPIPRPRPPIFSAAVAADETTVDGEVDSEEITGSIANPPAPPAPQTDVAAIPPPAPLPTRTAMLLDSEDLLPGDPAEILGEEKRLAPEIVEPEGIDPPRPVTGPPPAATPPPLGPVGEPYELVRTLQTLQDQIAQGSLDALETQRAVRTEIDRSFAAADPAVWHDPRNAVAAVTYVLSGGPPAILRRLATLDPKPAIDPRLISGVLAYIEGNEAEANKHLAKFDVARLSPSMGAQLALAKSALAVRTDPVAALRFLSIARLLAPGTLVEEAALRREIFIADRLKDAAMVEDLARQYLARFRNSVYAGNFRNRFAAAVSRMNLVKDEAGLSRIEELLLLLEPQARGQLYLTLARAAVVKGNGEAGAFAADHALALAPRASREEARAQLYRAASLIADSKAFDTAVAAIDRSDRKLLAPSDRTLHDAVSTMIAGIRRGTEVAAGSRRVVTRDLENDGAIEMSPVMTKARDAIAATDELVKGLPQ